MYYRCYLIIIDKIAIIVIKYNNKYKKKSLFLKFWNYQFKVSKVLPISIAV